MSRTELYSGRNVQRSTTPDKVSLTDSILVEIRDRIVFSEIPAGDILVETRLAEEYGMSKTPIREALALLSQEGLVEVLPRVGYRVTGISPHEVHEVFHLRFLLETEAVALAARRASQKEVLGLRQRNDTWLERLVAEGTPSLKSYTRFHDAFHLGVAVLSRNGRLTGFIQSLLQDSTRIRIRDPLMSVEGFAEDRELSERITEALLARDESVAQTMMKEHLAQSKARILDELNDPEAGIRSLMAGDRSSAR